MSQKPLVIVDPHFRSMDEIFTPQDRAHLYEIAEVVKARLRSGRRAPPGSLWFYSGA